MSDNFQAAYRRARQKIEIDAWPLLSDQQQEQAIAAELKAIDARGGAIPEDETKVATLTG
jgi:hypothetical protein